MKAINSNPSLVQNLNQAEAIYRNSKDYINNSRESNNNRVTPVMFVSKDQDIKADFYIESEAEEIYVPERAQRSPRNAKKNPYSKKGSPSRYKHDKFGNSIGTGIVGYQKYLHIVSKMAQDNTDQYEPGVPNYNAFLKVEEEEHQLEEEQRAIQREIEEQKRIIAE